jgi:hypothetical protein
MPAAPPRTLLAVVAGLAALAVAAVGCAADPDIDSDTDAPTNVPEAEEPDDEATGRTPVPTIPTSGTAGPSTPDPRPPSPEPAKEPVAKPAPKPGTEPSAQPTPAPKPVAKPAAKPAVISDGEHAGRLVSITTTEVTVKLVRILTGEEAIAAAKADGGGALDDDGTLPNDMYIQDLDRVVTIPVAGDGGFRIYDCSGGCQIVGTTVTALASGQAVPYGGSNAVINLTVDHGVVVSFEEQYLP